MRNKSWIVCCLGGLMMLSAALLLLIHNVSESNAAADQSDVVLNQIKDMMTAPEEGTSSGANDDLLFEAQKNDIYSQYDAIEEEPMTLMEYDGRTYCGYISIPSLGIELPVQNECSKSNLKVSPCRYTGTLKSNSLIIAAHNYRSHFGTIRDLNSNDLIVFTDCDNNTYLYEVSYTEYMEGHEVDKMFADEDAWDITLFTCTIGGKSRVVVRGVAVTD